MWWGMAVCGMLVLCWYWHVFSCKLIVVLVLHFLLVAGAEHITASHQC